MRIILFTGKGGVGKTSLAAATALRSAELGHKTVVLSTDIAHSLSDSFDLKLATEAVAIAPNLWGQEVQIYDVMQSSWGVIRQYVSALLAWRGMKDIVADEVAILPGMEELANLLYIDRYRQEGSYEVIIIDSAPTGETLRLLSFPEMMHWWMTRLFPVGRNITRTVGPVVGRLTNMPVPGNDVFDAITQLYDELYRIHALMTDATQTSIRLVVNPEKMVIKEAQRTLTYLDLFGYHTDAVICNRMLPASVKDSYFTTWKDSQQKYRALIEESFAPLPILDMPLLDQEVVGLPMLKTMARAVYGEEDPTRFYYKGRVQEIHKENGQYVLTLTLPFASKEDVGLSLADDELNVKVGSYRRNVVLPRILHGLEVEQARMGEGELQVRFKPGPTTGKK